MVGGNLVAGGVLAARQTQDSDASKKEPHHGEGTRRRAIRLRSTVFAATLTGVVPWLTQAVNADRGVPVAGPVSDAGILTLPGRPAQFARLSR